MKKQINSKLNFKIRRAIGMFASLALALYMMPSSINAVEYPEEDLMEQEENFLEVSSEEISPYVSAFFVNGKMIPCEDYPVGSKFQMANGAGYLASGECHAFGYEIFKYLYGSYTAYTEVKIGAALSTSSIIANYPTGTFIRANTGEYQHTMIYVGHSGTGIYVYHANWHRDIGENLIYIDYFTAEEFASKFPTVDYVRYHSHTYGAWLYYSSTQHSASCTKCGYTKYENHVTVGGGECTICNSTSAKKQDQGE